MWVLCWAAAVSVLSVHPSISDTSPSRSSPPCPFLLAKQFSSSSIILAHKTWGGGLEGCVFRAGYTAMGALTWTNAIHAAHLLARSYEKGWPRQLLWNTQQRTIIHQAAEDRGVAECGFILLALSCYHLLASCLSMIIFSMRFVIFFFHRRSWLLLKKQQLASRETFQIQNRLVLLEQFVRKLIRPGCPGLVALMCEGVCECNAQKGTIHYGSASDGNIDLLPGHQATINLHLPLAVPSHRARSFRGLLAAHNNTQNATGPCQAVLICGCGPGVEFSRRWLLDPLYSVGGLATSFSLHAGQHQWANTQPAITQQERPA